MIRCTILEELSGDGVTVTVRVIEYWVTVEGQHVPEMFCLVTDLMGIDERPPADLAALYEPCAAGTGRGTALAPGARGEPARRPRAPSQGARPPLGSLGEQA